MRQVLTVEHCVSYERRNIASVADGGTFRQLLRNSAQLNATHEIHEAQCLLLIHPALTSDKTCVSRQIAFPFSAVCQKKPALMVQT
jgi:hypothetical protein